MMNAIINLRESGVFRGVLAHRMSADAPHVPAAPALTPLTPESTAAVRVDDGAMLALRPRNSWPSSLFERLGEDAAATMSPPR